MNTIRFSLALAALVAGCTQTADEPAAPDAEAVARATGRTVAESGRVVSTFQTTITAGLDDTGAIGDAARARVQAAIAALVAAADCVSLSWAGLSATVQFEECQIPTTDERIDGALTVRLRPLDRSVELALDNLAIGPATFDGTLRAYVRGPIGNLTLNVDADLTLVDDSATLHVEGLDVEASAAGLALSGTADITTPSIDATTTTEQLHWILGDCLPSSGTVAFDGQNATGVLTFLPSTPTTGEVQLQIGNLPAVSVELLPACGA